MQLDIGGSGHGSLYVLKDVTAQINVLNQVAEVIIDIVCIDGNRCTAIVRRFKRRRFQQALHDGMQASRTDVLGTFIDLPGHFGNSLDAIVGKFESNVFGTEKRC